MRTLSIILLFVFASLGASAQSIGNRLNSFRSDKGDAYFIMEKKLSKHGKGVKKFIYDMTCIVQEDSVTMNFTVVSDNRNDIVKLTAENSDFSTTASSVQLLYHEAKGSSYEVRTTAKLSYRDLKQLYLSDSPIIFNFTDSNGASNQATYSLSEWNKERRIFDKIFYTMNK